MTNSNPKTVIILGAGSSVDCGYPTGKGLNNEIISWTKDNWHVLRRILWNNRKEIFEMNLQGQIEERLAFALKDPRTDFLLDQAFKGEMSEWTQSLGRVSSIDQFISIRPEFSVLAKLCILLVLSKHENPNFFENRDHMIEIPDSGGVRERKFIAPSNWYNLFWENLLEASQADFDKLKKILKSIRIITFNYDRSVEFFLLDSIRKIFGKSEKDYDDIPITHVYGRLGGLTEKEKIKNEYRTIDFRDPKFFARIIMRQCTQMKMKSER